MAIAGLEHAPFRGQRDDLIQPATVAAVFAYNAAMRDDMLPRKALPRPQGRGAARGGPGGAP